MQISNYSKYFNVIRIAPDENKTKQNKTKANKKRSKQNKPQK